MTKAEKLFNENFRLCRNHVRNHGFENIGYASLEDNGEKITTRTINDIQKLIDKERKEIERGKKLGVDVSEARKNGLEMLQITLNNHREHDKQFKEMMKEI